MKILGVKEWNAVCVVECETPYAAVWIISYIVSITDHQRLGVGKDASFTYFSGYSFDTLNRRSYTIAQQKTAPENRPKRLFCLKDVARKMTLNEIMEQEGDGQKR